MPPRLWKRRISAAIRRFAGSRNRTVKTRVLRLELLGERITPAVGAAFSRGTLRVQGDGADNSIEVSRDAAGTLRVNGGAVAVRGGVATVANTTQIIVYGLAGNDRLVLNEANGALPRATLYGGSGNDVLIGGSAADSLFGQDGDDQLFGKGGSDQLFGGANNDALTGGDQDDQVYGESGNDTLVWNPGDDSDLNEGGTGTDRVEVNGGNGAEVFSVTANGTRVRFDRLDPAPFFVDMGATESLLLNANGGDDQFSANGNLASLIQITVDGGAGNDTLRGSNGNDVLLGGIGSDFVDGQQGNDVVNLGDGDDVFQWDPGDGSDSIEGQAGTDTMVFNGAAISENFAIAANGERVRFTRNIANIVMDLNEVERLELQTLGGADVAAVGDLTGTDMSEVVVNLAAPGGVGDAQSDAVVVEGTAGNDSIDVVGQDTISSVVGLPALVRVTGLEAANDSLTVYGLAGNDGVTASTLLAGIVRLVIDGGAGNDTILGSQGNDVLLGGDDQDFVDGNQGNDQIDLGAGSDVFEWDPGDGSDVVQGQAGNDRMLFFGSNVSENIDVSANSGHVRFVRDIGSVTMDLDDVETIEYRALDGADTIAVNDLTATDLTRLDIDLRPSNGEGDGLVDTIVVNGTGGNDAIGVSGDAGGVRVLGLPVEVRIFQQEPTIDRLILNAQAGDDVVDAASLESDAIQLAINGGLGNDTLTGGQGDDLVNGGDGNDQVHLGAGDDTFVWNPGDDNDSIVGDDGVDTLLFNGANIGEIFALTAVGDHVRLSRDIASVVTDLDDIERVDINALGGADAITINDLNGTDVTEVNVALSVSGGGGDAQTDTVTVSGSAGDDVAIVAGDAGGVEVQELAAQVNITGAEAAVDRLVILMLDGNDVVDATSLVAGVINLSADGGANDDVLLGSAGNDIIVGGDGDDVLLGGPGADVLDGGTGDNIVIQD